MTTHEYVLLTKPELIFGEQELLGCHLEILNSMKSKQQYENLRKQELSLKLALRKKIAETEEQIKELEKMLPEVKDEPRHKEPKSEKPVEMPQEIEEILPATKQGRTIEDEIEEIQKKLRNLSY